MYIPLFVFYVPYPFHVIIPSFLMRTISLSISIISLYVSKCAWMYTYVYVCVDQSCMHVYIYMSASQWYNYTQSHLQEKAKC